MLFTRKGDDGTTSFFGSKKRSSKDSIIPETLGSLDEINSLIGVCKVKAEEKKFFVKGEDKSLGHMLKQLQNDLFVVQAEIAGSEKRLENKKILEIENYIENIEKELPKITSFFLAGGTELSASLDFARTVARRTERKVIACSRHMSISENSMAFMNRLSSVLYAMARLANHKLGVTEEPPDY